MKIDEEEWEQNEGENDVEEKEEKGVNRRPGKHVKK